MAKFYSEAIGKKLSGANLVKLGAVNIKPTQTGKNLKITAGAYKNKKLQDLIKKIGSGKSISQIKEGLRKVGVDYKKRNKVENILTGGRKNGLTPEQIKGNLKLAKRETMQDPNLAKRKQNALNFINQVKPGVKSAAENIGLTEPKIGLAGGWPNNASIGAGLKR
ncbi:MAG: hypothetical protein Q8O93_04285 [bacterium]|nr:hypothetical protein [bacterium]